MSDLIDRLDRDVEAWKPEPGDKIVGKISSIEVFDGKYGEYPLLVVDTDDGEVALHCFHTVLKSELARKRPVEGDRIGVKYLGRNIEGGYESYRVVLERARPVDKQVDWDRVKEDADSEAGTTAPPSSIREAVAETQDGYGPDEAPF